MRCLLGIDLGTSGLKAQVLDLEGKPLGKGYVANQYLPGPAGWAEQDPRMWWAACCEAVRTAVDRSRIDAADIAGIGVCGFHHCPVFLDAEGEPARPSIVTHDARLPRSLDELHRSGVLDEVSRLSGSRVVTGHFPTVYHTVWQQDRERLSRTRWLMLAKDYLRFKLTGTIGTELCDATGTNLVAMPQASWSGRLCDLLQVPPDLLPPIGSADQVCGGVTGEAARSTGLKAGTPVVYGGGDSHCALVGLGVIASGQAGLLLGTNSTLRASFGRFLPEIERAVWAQQHVVAGQYTVSASSMAGSSVLSWLKDVCFGEAPEEAEGSAYQAMATLAAAVRPGCDGLLFHPYLHGERSPFSNPAARGSFVGATHRHHREHFVRATLEGVGYCIANCFETLQAIGAARGEAIDTLRVSESGGARLHLWRQIIADALDRSLEVVDADEAGCLGASLLAGVGVGVYPDLPAAVSRGVRVSSVVSPDPADVEIYRAGRGVFNATYRALEALLYRTEPDREAQRPGWTESKENLHA